MCKKPNKLVTDRSSIVLATLGFAGSGGSRIRYRWGSAGKRAYVAGLTVLAGVLGVIQTLHGALVSGPDIISPPASVDTYVAGGTINKHQQAFDEKQCVVLPEDVQVDPGGVFIPAGTAVDSAMIFLNPDGTSNINDVQDWTFDGPVLGIMSDKYGAFEAASNWVLGASGTTYPGSFTYRGLETWGAYTDSATFTGNVVTVNMTAISPGDWIRVVTASQGCGITFSLEYGSPSITTQKAADIFTVGTIPASAGLHPASTAPGAIQRVINGAAGGLGILAGGGKAGCPGPVIRDLDALSFGRDKGSGIYFSVDEWADGIAGTAPDVYSEGASGCKKAAPDVFAWAPGFGGNKDCIDGNGAGAGGCFAGVALGLIDHSPPDAPWVDQGDNVDALDVDTRASDLAGPIYFSLRGRFVDPNENDLACWTGCAQATGFSGGDVLMVAAVGAPIKVYAAAADLGLDLNGPGTDDLDALALWNVDGDDTFNVGVDVLYFSVRRGSAIILPPGTLDCTGAAKISEGDVLAPCLGGGVQVVVPATTLGLYGNEPDELDALDLFLIAGDATDE